MGRYCYQCGDKISNTAIPSTCECFVDNIHHIPRVKKVQDFIHALFGRPPVQDYFEGFCLGCWNQIFETRYKKIEQDMFVLKDGQYEKYPRAVFQIQKTNLKCPWCQKKFNIDEYYDLDEVISLERKSEHENQRNIMRMIVYGFRDQTSEDEAEENEAEENESKDEESKENESSEDEVEENESTDEESTKDLSPKKKKSKKDEGYREEQ